MRRVREKGVLERGETLELAIRAGLFLERELRACGASGWTVTLARGEGSRNRRVGDLDGGNVRIESLVSNDTAAAVMQRLADDYFTHYAIVAWVADVAVHRSERYI